MANSYTHIYIHFIFTVKGRNNLLPSSHKLELHKFIKGMIEKRDSILVAINNMEDHVHLLVRLTPTYSISRLMQEIKSVSSKFINDKRWMRGKFKWQRGYAAFSNSKSQIENVIRYIDDQEIHHLKRTFREEFIGFLDKYQIEYEDKYLFEFYD
jgi:REP element-mobilizing transposase RayT